MTSPYPGGGEQTRNPRPQDCHNEVIRQLLGYWHEKRGARRFPARADLDPLEMRYALGNIVLFDRISGTMPPRFRYRLIGTAVIERDGYDMTGRDVDELPGTQYRQLILSRLAGLIADPAPLVIRNQALYDGRRYDYEVLWLPLAADGMTVDMFLSCQMFPTEPPSATR
jgi:hypothetical protein